LKLSVFNVAPEASFTVTVQSPAFAAVLALHVLHGLPPIVTFVSFE
jgi:hypothetical protein